MFRVRIAFSKQDPVRWLSHLDTQKAFERAMRRAAIPLAFSEGFNPHPKIAFASALAVGIVSFGEYVDIDLAAAIDTAEVRERLQKAMPEGFGIHGVKAVPPGTQALMAAVNRAQYRLRVPLQEPLDETAIAAALSRSLAETSWLVEREGKKGVSTKDIRAGLFQLTGSRTDDALILEMLVQTGSEGNVRPEEVLEAVCRYGNLSVDRERVRILRLGLFVAQGERLLTPMDVL
ncbi:DUF2344 domain-containing protein [Heliobacterium undosum]|uniref:DUF2344 domain-containing protein n=1 Tax=Heliomicrobium undosum TaxID=121734 RepID=A0A845L0T8_9FIRM|nr:TIGR03936 family radical SAM-associated protein [Heliomicrobium undosum]MZP30132.1 DUF2344 domain-containing protein [Heliomicrobium undosum]